MRKDHLFSIACPACGYAFKCGTHLEDLDGDGDDKKPYAGAISLCLNCGTFGIFEGEPVASIREMLKEEFAELRLKDPLLYERANRAVAIIRERGPIPGRAK